MNKLPRGIIPVIRLALALAFLGFTAVQLVVIPAVTIHDLGDFDWSVKEIALVTPVALIFMGLMACLQVIIVCTWWLLTLVASDEIFSAANTRWVNGLVRAMWVAWFLLAGLAPYAWMVAEYDDAPGVLLIGFMLGLVATCALGLMLVMRELLRRATDLRTDMDAVI